MRIAVVGATSWGCTLATLAAAGEAGVVMVTRHAAEADGVRALRGIARIPEAVLPTRVEVCEPKAMGSVDRVLLAVPAQALRATLVSLPVTPQTPVLSAAKGLERSTQLRMSAVIASLGWAPGKIAALSGPNLAHEVARGLPAAAVVASADVAEAIRWQEALNRPAFRVYTSADVTGVELAGALKNIIAIAAGAAAGLGLGANAVAAVMTRGLAEITRLGVALGADPLTFQGLAGVGDLSVTCFSPLSRNRRLGELLAQGRTPSAALAEIGEVAEGAASAPVAVEMARRAGVELPIAEQVVAVLAGTASVHDAMAVLLGRGPRAEQDLARPAVRLDEV